MSPTPMSVYLPFNRDVLDAAFLPAKSAGTRGADIRNVTVQGRAEILPDGPERAALIQGFLQKYHPHLEALWGGRAMPADRVMFRIVPERVRSRGV